MDLEMKVRVTIMHAKYQIESELRNRLEKERTLGEEVADSLTLTAASKLLMEHWSAWSRDNNPKEPVRPVAPAINVSTKSRRRR